MGDVQCDIEEALPAHTGRSGKIFHRSAKRGKSGVINVTTKNPVRTVCLDLSRNVKNTADSAQRRFATVIKKTTPTDAQRNPSYERPTCARNETESTECHRKRVRHEETREASPNPKRSRSRSSTSSSSSSTESEPEHDGSSNRIGTRPQPTLPPPPPPPPPQRRRRKPRPFRSRSYRKPGGGSTETPRQRTAYDNRGSLYGLESRAAVLRRTHGTTETRCSEYIRFTTAITNQREYLLDLFVKGSSRLVFIDALTDDSVCLGYAVTSCNNICEGVGIPYDTATRGHVVTSAVLYNRKRTVVHGSAIDPWDIARFVVANTDFPVLIGCDFEKLLSSDANRRLLNDLVYLKNPESGPETCTWCTHRACYIEATQKVLFCDRHAKVFRGKLQLFKPTFVTVDVCTDGIQMHMLLYGSEDSDPLRSSRWVPLAHRIVTGSMTPNNRYGEGRQYGEHLAGIMDIAKSLRLDWQNDDCRDPLNAVKTLQNVCLTNSWEWTLGSMVKYEMVL